GDDQSGDEHVWLVVGLCLQIGDDRELGEIVGRLPHDLLEQVVGDFDLDEIEIDEIGRDLAALESLDVGIISQHGVKLHFFRHGTASLLVDRSQYSNSCAVIPGLGRSAAKAENPE